MFLHDHTWRALRRFPAAHFILTMSLALGCKEEKLEGVALILECFEHTGEEDDPCPSGCAQVGRAFNQVVPTGPGECNLLYDDAGRPAGRLFCAPGTYEDFIDPLDSYQVWRRMDLLEPSNGEFPVIPEDIRLMPGGNAGWMPGWNQCGPEDSELCSCAHELLWCLSNGDPISECR